MAVAVRDISAPSAHEWFETRSYRHGQFADLAGLAARKREIYDGLTAWKSGFAQSAGAVLTVEIDRSFSDFARGAL